MDFTQLITSLLESDINGYLALFVGTFLASTLIPLSADAMLYGMLYTDSSVLILLLVATFGNWLGSVTSFYLGYLGKWAILTKYFRIKQAKVESLRSYVKRYAPVMSLLAWLPIVGDLFCIALGFFRVPVALNLILIFVGKLLRFIAIIYIYLYFS